MCEQVGDNVLLQNTKKLSRKGSKYEQSWKGPYEIAERAGKGRYYVRKQNDAICKTLYNATRLKPFHQRQELSQPSVPSGISPLFVGKEHYVYFTKGMLVH